MKIIAEQRREMDSLKSSLNSILCGLQRDFLARKGVDIIKKTQKFKSAS